MDATEKWFPAAAGIEIVVLTIAGLVGGWLAPGLDYEAGMAGILVGVLLFVAVADVLIVRFVILPKNLASGAPRQSVVVLGYAFVMAVAIYGLVASIMTGQGLVALPFAAIALVGYYAVWSFLEEAVRP